MLASEKSESGLYVTKGHELIVDSSYIHYLKTLKSKEIIELLKSDESDLATYVTLNKVYGQTPPTNLFNLGKNKAESWRKATIKEKVIKNWQEELLKHNHDSLRLIYLKNNG